jgi:large subunit ribosomal protein L10
VKDASILPALSLSGGEDFSLPKARKEQKAEQVEVLTEKLRKAKVALLTDYRGLTVTQLQELRGKLRTGDVEYRVVKNTLARRAAEAAGVPALQSELEGPVAIAFGYDDLSVPSKLINEFVRTTRLKLDVKGGLVEGRVFSPDQVKQLADLPSRETLIAQLMGTLQSPVSQLVGIMQTPVQQLIGVLNAYKTKLEAA